jgi:methylamine dehydrogenase heavy chain
MNKGAMMTPVCSRLAAVLLAGIFAGSLAASALAQTVVAEAEEATVNTLETPKSSWFFVKGGWGSAGSSIFDSATGKMIGMIATGRDSDLAIDPAGKAYYVAETIWTKGNRGTRQDLVAVYDAKTLKLLSEIPTPGRLIIGGLKTNFVLSDDGKTAYDYNFDPASSVNVIDLVKRKFVRAIELPGCANLIPNPGVGFSSLCADGTLATITVRGATQDITRTEPFFDAAADPIFANFTYDRKKKQAVFLSYTGMVRTATISAKPVVSEPFSIQQAAGLRVADTKPLDIAWYPGGSQVMALHRPSQTLYVLMHMGEYWTHKEGGKEIWALDLATRKVTKRIPLKEPVNNIEITQDDAAMIIVTDRKNNAAVIDAKTGENKHTIENAGGGHITVVEPM